ncbi:MAG: hypothetical protein LQ344_002232 [Seirophora lacunosa]|nr:MAG: hypothetical protein LQ344_002232 [Seirophora lacunosa]
MLFAQSLLVVSTLVFTFAATTPAELPSKGHNIIIHESVPKPFKKSGPAAILSAYRKYNGTAQEDVVRAAAKNDGTAMMGPTHWDPEFLTSVTIGGQVVNLEFDTASSDLWCFSSDLPESVSSGHSLYNPSLSSTSEPRGGFTWSMAYGDNSGASGTVYMDNVRVGTTTITGQTVELAQQISPEFQIAVDNDGVFGLGFDNINSRTFFSNVKASLSSPLFTANLRKGRSGTYTFGYVDAGQHSGSITYVPVNPANGYWQFTSSGYALGSDAFVSENIDSIVDTGTALLFLPTPIVVDYYNKVRGATYDYAYGGFTYPCRVPLPSFTLGIGGYKAQDAGIGFSVIGTVFLKSQFVVFDTEMVQLGFAPKGL